MHRFGSCLEMLYIATGVVQAYELQVQADVIRILGELVEQLILIGVGTRMRVIEIGGTEAISE